MTRVFIIHGWADTPNNGWFPWLRKELERKGYVVIAPQMPEANVPRIEKWIPYLQKIVGAIN
ncbi:MAG: alpha/beta hydrolase, partial [Parcubacteria group bacterium]|nr:alpha/beta hydrolase [Parcubacteria group bacterium]